MSSHIQTFCELCDLLFFNETHYTPFIVNGKPDFEKCVSKLEKEVRQNTVVAQTYDAGLHSLCEEYIRRKWPQYFLVKSGEDVKNDETDAMYSILEKMLHESKKIKTFRQSVGNKVPEFLSYVRVVELLFRIEGIYCPNGVQEIVLRKWPEFFAVLE